MAEEDKNLEYPAITLFTGKMRAKPKHILLLLQTFTRENWKREAPNEQVDLELFQFSELETQIHLYLTVKYYQRFVGIGKVDFQSINDMESLITVSCSPGNLLLDENRGEIYEAGLNFLLNFIAHLIKVYDISSPSVLNIHTETHIEPQAPGGNEPSGNIDIDAYVGLSDKERQILALYYQGKKIRVIADEMGYTAGAVHNALSSMRKKLPTTLVPYRKKKK